MDILKNLREVFRGLKRRRTVSIKLCPRCGSPKIRLSSSLDIWLTPEQYVCERCSYKGPIVIEAEKEGDLHQD